jgi:hypothetical protein
MFHPIFVSNFKFRPCVILTLLFRTIKHFEGAFSVDEIVTVHYNFIHYDKHCRPVLNIQ